MPTKHVFRLRPEYDKLKRPWVNFNIDASKYSIGLSALIEILEGQSPVPKKVAIHFHKARVEQWDVFSFPGTLCVLSRRALDILQAYASTCFDTVQAMVGSDRFCFLRQRQPLNCLDRKRAAIRYFPDEPDVVMHITNYHFKKKLIADPLLFYIPEYPVELFGTDGIKDIIEREGLKGFRIDDAEELQ